MEGRCVNMDYTIFSNEISPFVRFAGYRETPCSISHANTCAYDCRLFYFLSGAGSLYIRNIAYEIHPEEIYLLPPFFPYRIDCLTDTAFYLLNFDYLPHHAKIAKAIPVEFEANADKSRVHQTVHFADFPQFDDVIRAHLPGISHTLSAMAACYRDRIVYGQCEMNAYLSLILAKVFRQSLIGNKKNNISPIIDYIQNHYAENINNRSIAARFHYHPNYVNRLFVRHTGASLHQYLLTCRVEAAIDLLTTSDHSLSEIAAMTGFSCLSYFSRYFKKVTGYSPSQYRKS